MRLVIGGLIKPSWVVLLSSKAVQAKFVACLLVCLLRRIQPRRSFIWAMVRLFEGRWAYMLTAPKTCRMQPSPARDNQQLTNCTATYIVRQQLTKGPASHIALRQQQLGYDL